MNQPLTRKLLFLFFLGLPGLALQAIGGVVAIYGTVLVFSLPGYTAVMAAWLLIPLAVFALGALMQAFYDALDQSGLPHAEVPVERALVVLEKSLTLAAAVAITASIILLATGEAAALAIAWILLIVFCAACLTSIAYRRKHYRKRMQALPEAQP